MEQINKRFIDYKNRYEVSLRLVWEVNENTSVASKSINFASISPYVGKFKQAVVKVDSMFVKTALDPSVESMDNAGASTYEQMVNNFTTGEIVIVSSLPQPNRLRASMGGETGAIAMGQMKGTRILGSVPAHCVISDPSWSGGTLVNSIDANPAQVRNNEYGGYTPASDANFDPNTIPNVNYTSNKNYGGAGLDDGVLTSNPFGQNVSFNIMNSDGVGFNASATDRICADINLSVMLIDPLEPELTPSEFRF